MPSQYHREQAGGPALQLHSLLPYSTSCTPQAHYRSSEALTYPQTPLDTMESWFPMSSAVESRDCRSTILNAQAQASEKPMGTAVSEDTSMENVFHLGDFQSETWWPPIAIHGPSGDTSLLTTDILKQDRRGSNNMPTSSAKFSQELNKDHHSFDMQPWCHQSNNSLTPSCADLPPPIALTFTPTSSVEPPASTHVKNNAKDRQKGLSASAPASLSEWRAPKEKTSASLGVQKKWTGKRPVSQRESHIWSERQRRKGMNHLFSTLRSLLPHPTSKTDKSTVVSEIIKYIQSLQQKLEILTNKRQQMMAARTLHPFHTMDPRPKSFVSNGLTLVDHTGDSSAMTAVTALPPPGSESCLQSYLGANVGLHVCGLNVFITISSPRGRRGVFQRILVTVHNHQLDVINANISSSSASIFHCLHCQAAQGAELLKDNLHTALQSVISNFDLSP